MQVDLTPYQAICTVGAIERALRYLKDHYKERGCPAFMADATRDHLEAHVETHKLLVTALRAEGYPMSTTRDQSFDIEAALRETPYIHTPDVG